MKIKVILSALKLLAFISISSLSFQANSASFDCAKAKSQIEISICSDASLGTLDEQLADTYSKVRKNLSEPAKNKVRQYQLAWLKSLPQNCSSELKSKNPISISSCLSNSYETQISFWEKYLKPILGYFKFPVGSFKSSAFGSRSNVEVEYLDGNSANAILINRTIDKFAKNDIADGDELRSSINQLTNSVAIIEVNANTNGGAHPDFYQNWFYIDLASSKQLKADYFFQKMKLREISKIIVKNIKTGANKETLECYEFIDEKYILDILSNDFSSVLIEKNNISLVLGVPRYCRSQDRVDIETKLIRQYLTENYKF